MRNYYSRGIICLCWTAGAERYVVSVT